MKQQFIELLNREYAIIVDESQFVFIDNLYASEDLSDFEHDELYQFRNQLEHFRNKTLQHEPFMCHDIRAVLSQNDQLTHEIELRNRQIDQARLKHQDEVMAMEL